MSNSFLVNKTIMDNTYTTSEAFVKKFLEKNNIDIFSQTKNKIVGFESLGYTLNIVHTVLSDDSINLIDKQIKIENLGYPFLVKFNTTKNSYPKRNNKNC